MLEPQTVKEASSQLVDTLVGLESNKYLYLECLEKKLRQHELIFLAPPAEGRQETIEPRESKDVRKWTGGLGATQASYNCDGADSTGNLLIRTPSSFIISWVCKMASTAANDKDKGE